MKFLILASLSWSIAAHAVRVNEIETIGSCVIMTITKPSHGGAGEIVHTSRIPFRFPKVDEVRRETDTGPATSRFGVGRVVLDQEIPMIESDGSASVRPITIVIEVNRLSKTLKELRVSGRMFNIFTGEMEEIKEMVRSTPAWDTFLYPEHFITSPNRASLPVGAITQTAFICPLSHDGAAEF